LKLAEGQGGPEKAKALEKAKRKWVSSSVEPKKRGRLIDAILHQSPCKARGTPKTMAAKTATARLPRRHPSLFLKRRHP